MSDECVGDFFAHKKPTTSRRLVERLQPQESGLLLHTAAKEKVSEECDQCETGKTLILCSQIADHLIITQ